MFVITVLKLNVSNRVIAPYVLLITPGGASCCFMKHGYGPTVKLSCCYSLCSHSENETWCQRWD